MRLNFLSVEFLLEKGYIVHGIKRRASLFNTQRVDHIYQDPHIEHANFKLHYGDLTDTSNLVRIVQETQPDEIYNLGAQSTSTSASSMGCLRKWRAA
ncbi:GDP-mannose 4,6-dehydratase [mine drainage metagenome]|uniref:GDP-mannose 4,6-dehydratase n=1 Tax=mine drainage metagenome TaxID=410659 RepID=A0A1J5PSK4_9ZZZZ